jgi:hypothetical protein
VKFVQYSQEVVMVVPASGCLHHMQGGGAVEGHLGLVAVPLRVFGFLTAQKGGRGWLEV